MLKISASQIIIYVKFILKVDVTMTMSNLEMRAINHHLQRQMFCSNQMANFQ
jgi:hypothetical protein